MPDLSPQERLQPALLDRLRDDHPDRQVESFREKVITERELHESVVRDLEWLFGTGALPEGFDAEAYPETARSVVNYGIPNLAGQALASGDTFDIERAVREAILNFEPRILPDSLDVQVRADFSALNRNRLVIELHGQVWGIPVPLEFFLWTELDVETGEVHVSPDRRA